MVKALSTDKTETLKSDSGRTINSLGNFEPPIAHAHAHTFI